MDYTSLELSDQDVQQLIRSQAKDRPKQQIESLRGEAEQKPVLRSKLDVYQHGSIIPPILLGRLK